MYIKFELYRAKNGELFDQEMIEWPLQTDEDIVEITERVNTVLAQHLQTIPQVQKYGTAYIGRMKIAGIEINDNDYTCELDEQAFKDYVHNESVWPGVDIVWNKGKVKNES